MEKTSLYLEATYKRPKLSIIFIFIVYVFIVLYVVFHSCYYYKLYYFLIFSLNYNPSLVISFLESMPLKPLNPSKDLDYAIQDAHEQIEDAINHTHHQMDERFHKASQNLE